VKSFPPPQPDNLEGEKGRKEKSLCSDERENRKEVGGGGEPKTTA